MILNQRNTHSAITAIIKKRFTNFTVEETNNLVWDIIEAIETSERQTYQFTQMMNDPSHSLKGKE